MMMKMDLKQWRKRKRTIKKVNEFENRVLLLIISR